MTVNQLVIPIHSIVDIITNSSTVIYTGVTKSGEQAIRDIIDHVLREAGRTDLVAGDLYDIKVFRVNEEEERIEELLEERGISYSEDAPEEQKREYWEAYDNLYSEIESKTFRQIETEIYSNDASVGTESCVIVTPKRNKTDDVFTKALSKIFEVKESYG